MNRPALYKPPWQVGIEAARANLQPGLFVQAAMLGVVLAYYFWPEARPIFAQLAAWKLKWGFLYSAASAAIAGGILPELLRIAAFQGGRPKLENLKNACFLMLFWSVQGVAVDLFYRYQAVWFGTTATFGVIAAKVCVDQFMYNPIFAAPFGVTILEWREKNWRWSPQFLTADFYRRKIFPALLATWGFWIPTVSLVYALPLALQIPVFNLALTCWSLIFMWISSAETTVACEVKPSRNQQ